MKILVLGAGAIGGFFGARLIEGGADVTFLVRPERQRLLKEHGLKLTSPYGDFSGPVNAITSSGPFERYDYVFLTCKSYDLDSAIEAIRGAVSRDTQILPLLNGISHIDRLNTEFGQERVLGGVARVQVGLNPDGSIQNIGHWRAIMFGRQDGAITEDLKALGAAFPTYSVEVEIVEDIMQRMWEKLVQLATGAGGASLLRARVDEIVAVPGGADFLLQLFELNAEIAKREGFPPSEAFLAHYREVFSATKDAYEPSMLRDIRRGNPTEGGHVIGFLLERARKHGIEAGLLEMVDLSLRVYEAHSQSR